MIKGTSRRIRKHPALPQRAAWALARTFLLSLMVLLDWVPRVTPAAARTGLVRFFQAQVNIAEHIFRCLLMLMRAAPAAPRPAPFQPAADGAAIRAVSARPKGAPDFLCLSQVMQGFARYGEALPPTKARSSLPPPSSLRGPGGPTAPAPVADPLDILSARLGVLRAVLDAPHAHAARIAALMQSAGLTPGARKARRPEAALWLLLNHAAKSLAAPAPGPLPDTS